MPPPMSQVSTRPSLRSSTDLPRLSVPRTHTSESAQRIGAQLHQTALTASAAAEPPPPECHQAPIAASCLVSAAAPCWAAAPRKSRSRSRQPHEPLCPLTARCRLRQGRPNGFAPPTTEGRSPPPSPFAGCQPCKEERNGSRPRSRGWGEPSSAVPGDRRTAMGRDFCPTLHHGIEAK